MLVVDWRRLKLSGRTNLSWLLVIRSFQFIETFLFLKNRILPLRWRFTGLVWLLLIILIVLILVVVLVLVTLCGVHGLIHVGYRLSSICCARVLILVVFSLTLLLVSHVILLCVLITSAVDVVILDHLHEIVQRPIVYVHAIVF